MLHLGENIVINTNYLSLNDLCPITFRRPLLSDHSKLRYHGSENNLNPFFTGREQSHKTFMTTFARVLWLLAITLIIWTPKILWTPLWFESGMSPKSSRVDDLVSMQQCPEVGLSDSDWIKGALTLSVD